MASKWRRVMAVSCTHGDLVHPEILKQVYEFESRFNPYYRFFLGDGMDSSCFRAGAVGTKDEAHSPRDDKQAAKEFIRKYRPTHWAWGNHEWRLFELMTHPKAIIAELSESIWKELNQELEKVHAKTVPYDIEDGWFELGGTYWGHGFMYNMNSVRDHAEMLGGPVVMGHLHAPQMVPGRTRKASPSFCVGAIADDRKLTYGRRRRNSLTHGHGLIYGEVSDTQAHLNLLRSKNGELLHIPSWI